LQYEVFCSNTLYVQYTFHFPLRTSVNVFSCEKTLSPSLIVTTQFEPINVTLINYAILFLT